MYSLPHKRGYFAFPNGLVENDKRRVVLWSTRNRHFGVHANPAFEHNCDRTKRLGYLVGNGWAVLVTLLYCWLENTANNLQAF